ncbi:MAG: hypothetical protein LBV68_01950 [Spirochaetaceae bacterium]|nr:hypothetical protein [Spirochaetaceae bacterium]
MVRQLKNTQDIRETLPANTEDLHHAVSRMKTVEIFDCKEDGGVLRGAV